MSKENWTNIIEARSGWFDLKLNQLWSYRDLIILFVKRDFTAVYKQTILGPFWHLLQPLFSSLIFSLAFSFIGRISTQSIPPVLFYLSGIVPWSYFADCVTRTSSTFVSNSHLFGKVYFPRLTAPIAVVISNLIKFFIQLSLFIAAWIFYASRGSVLQGLNYFILFIPVLLFVMALMGCGVGLIVASLTVRYKDLSNLVGFVVQFLMYMSPVIFPSTVWPENLRWIVEVNPMSSIIEAFRFGFLGVGATDGIHLLYSGMFALIVFFTGVIFFSRAEKNFIDTI